MSLKLPKTCQKTFYNLQTFWQVFDHNFDNFDAHFDFDLWWWLISIYYYHLEGLGLGLGIVLVAIAAEKVLKQENDSNDRLHHCRTKKVLFNVLIYIDNWVVC